MAFRQNTDMLGLLEPLSWRGVVLPITARSARFANEVVRHKVLYTAWALVESLAPTELVYSYTIPFREGIARAPYKELFSKGLRPFLESCIDDTPGDLIDPVHGTIRAQCISYNEVLDLTRRDGVDVEVEFVYSREEATELVLEKPAGISAIKSEAAALDADVATVDWAQEAPPEALVDPLAALSGMVDQVQLAGGQLALGVEGAINRCVALVETVEALGDPTAWPCAQSARRVQGQLQTALDKGQVGAGETILTFVAPEEMGISAVAMRLGVGIGALLALNPGIAAGGGRVRKGASVRYAAS